MTAKPQTLTDTDLLRVRMRALGLASGARQAELAVPESDRQGSPGAERIAAVARRMLAMQGQDWRSSQWALGVRAPGTSVADVRAAYAAHLIVRSWPMRGTIHVVAAEDIGWMQAATNHRVLGGAPKRREFLGMSDAVLDQLVEVSRQALAHGASHDRDSLSQVWTDAGIEWKSNWRYHVIWWLCQNGIAVFADPHEGGEPRLVLADDWIREPRSLSGDDALAELAQRYALGRGPVLAKDFAWWTGLTVSEARKGITLAAEAGGLVPLSREGVTGAAAALWAVPELLDAPSGVGDPSPGIAAHDDNGSHLLLPAFDEHLLGYTERSAQLDPAHFDRIVPGRNGMFLATVVRDGRVIGTWRRGTRKSSGIEVTEFSGETAEQPLDSGALAAPAAAWSSFHELTEPLSVTTLEAA